MELHRFLSLLAAFVGLVGAIFLSKGILASSHEHILKLTGPGSHWDYAPEQIDSLAKQKADTKIGVIYIILAFSIQVISLIFVTNQNISLIKTRWMLFWVILALISVLTICFSVLGNYFYKHHKREIGKIAVKDYCIRTFSRKVIDPLNVEGLEPMSQELLNLRREPSESMEHFIRRVVKYVGWTVPDHIDFSKFDSEKVEKK